MMKASPEPELEVELLRPAAIDDATSAGCWVARVSRADETAGRFAVGDWVLAPAGAVGSHGHRVQASACIALPLLRSLERASAAPPLALALWIWDLAGLESGEVAVYTSRAGLDRALGMVAGWRSARDVMRVDTCAVTDLHLPGVVSLSATEPDVTGRRLSTALRTAPGAAAAVMTAGSDALDLILEAMPMWGRVVLAAAASDPATIDFYNNVHRKGCRMLSAPGSPAEMFDATWIRAAECHVGRAARILHDERLAAAYLS